MPDVTPAAGRPSYCYVLTRLTRAGDRVGVQAADITDRVVDVGPLEEREEELPGVGAVASAALACLPDERLAPDGALLGGRGPGDDVTLTVVARDAAGGEAVVFTGRLAEDPSYREDVDDLTVTLRFVGLLAALWDEEPLRLAAGGGELAWGHVGDTLVPALLAAAYAAPTNVRINAPALKSAEPLWSYFGEPAATVAVPGVGRYDVKGLAWDAKRGLVYVGVGPFVQAFEPATRRWTAAARIVFGGGNAEARGETWRVAHLEYDGAADCVRGVAESDAADVTRRASHLKATFVIPLSG